MRKIVLLIAVQLLVVACGGKKDTPAPAPETPKPASSSELVTPLNNQVCTESPVTFKWGKVEHATNYILSILNANGTSYKEFTLSDSEKTVNLPKGKSFSWKVTAKNEKGETVSETRSFITEGEAVANFVPTALIKIDGDSKSVAISFYDNDKDSLTYTLYYATNNSFSKKDIVKGHDKVVISSGKIVTLKELDFGKKFWLKVVVIDDKGNKSETIGSF